MIKTSSVASAVQTPRNVCKKGAQPRWFPGVWILDTLGARDFSSAVSKFPLPARKTSGTQGRYWMKHYIYFVTFVSFTRVRLHNTAEVFKACL